MAAASAVLAVASPPRCLRPRGAGGRGGRAAALGLMGLRPGAWVVWQWMGAVPGLVVLFACATDGFKLLPGVLSRACGWPG